MANNIPPLPPGFVLDESVPPLPPGFELEQPKTRAFGEEVARTIGLGARGALEGIGGAIGLFTDPVSAGISSLTAEPYEPMAQSAGRLATAVGLPQAQSGLERVFTTGTSGATGAGGFARAAGAAAPALGQLGRSVLTRTAELPVQQTIAGATGAGAAQVASESGAGPVGQVVAGLAAGGLAGRIGRPMTPEAQQTISTAERLGIPLSAEPGTQVRAVAEAARRQVPDEIGSRFPAVQEAVRAEREAARRSASELFDQARDQRATSPVRQVKNLALSARDALADFDVQAMPQISKRMAEIDALANIPGVSAVKLNALERWRTRISAMSPKDGSPEQAAATALRRNYDQWLDGQFNNSMIQGDQQAINAWKSAREAWAGYKQRFDANKTISDLAKKDTTQEQMRQWIFNSSAVGAKKEAGLVVRKLNEILGPNSREMAGLRAEMMSDVVSPLLKDTPDIKAFLENYDKTLRNNPTLVKELFPQGIGEVENLARFARGIADRPGAKINPNQSEGIWDVVGRLLTRYTFGHGIAQAGARVQAAQGIVSAARRKTIGGAAKRELIRRYLGVESKDLMIPPGIGAEVGVLTTDDIR